MAVYGAGEGHTEEGRGTERESGSSREANLIEARRERLIVNVTGRRLFVRMMSKELRDIESNSAYGKEETGRK
jgi:hypothetical protein